MVNYRCQLSLNDRYYTDNPGRFRLFLYKVLDTVVFIIVDAQAVVASTPRALLNHDSCHSSPSTRFASPRLVVPSF
jgi:hypothetical protein